jgi:hypothetical protein
MPMLAVRRSRPLLVATILGLMVVTALAGLASAAPNPPGNNGTIKIDDTPFDDHPNNDFYGYDEGDLFAEVTFESHPPTGPVRVLLTDRVFIGEDDNSGGGSEAGLDASVTYTLDFTGIEPHPNQGFHVKLTINAEGSQGADVKHKVFWSTGCVPAPTTTTTAPTTTTSSTTTTTIAPTTTVEPTTTIAPTTTMEPTTTTMPPSSTVEPTTTSDSTTSTTEPYPTTTQS